MHLPPSVQMPRSTSNSTGSRKDRKTGESPRGSDTRTSSTSPSVSSTPENGFAKVIKYLRSPLTHPMSILMISFLNDALPTLPDDFWRVFDDRDVPVVEEALTYTSGNVRDGIFSSAVANWKTDSEVKLTQEIVAKIESLFKEKKLHGFKYVPNKTKTKKGDNENEESKESNDENEESKENNDENKESKENEEALLTIESEKEIKGDNKTGFLDFVVSKKHTSSEKNEMNNKSVVMIMEFGIKRDKQPDIWWEKMDQVVQYVEMLCANTDKNYVFDQPILLTVVTVTSRNKTSNCGTISETTATDTTTSSVNESGAEDKNEANVNDNDQKQPSVDADREADTNATADNTEEKLDVRFGVFLCTPRQSDDGGNQFRVALLWRKDTSTVQDASAQFGKILYAAQLCAKWREQVSAKSMKSNQAFYQYLGPNCCRIGTWVCSYFFPMESIFLFESI